MSAPRKVVETASGAFETRTVTCKTCGKVENYARRAGERGKPPTGCADHRLKPKKSADPARIWRVVA